MQRVNAQHGNYYCDVCNKDNDEVNVGGGGVVRPLDWTQLIEDGRHDEERCGYDASYPAPFDLEDIITLLEFLGRFGSARAFLFLSRNWLDRPWI
jgi:hypothetical protein